jgi:pre-mRNA-processing factor 40
MLGQAGSSPLDLFWEVVVEEDKKLEATLQEVKDTLRSARFNVTPKTSLEEFMSIVRTDRRLTHINHVSMEAIFNRLHDDELRRDEEDKRHAERKHHDAIDDLRSKIRRLDPPVTLSDTWEKVRPRVEKSKEYKALKSDELRRAAFEKHLRRLKEKEHGKESRRRSADRDHRNGHSPRRRHTSHTPEYDAYEEHRRKAQADRERQYQRSSMSRISPAPRHRDERDRYERGNPSRPTSSHYDPRERSNLHRSTARNPESELDYDNEAPARDDSREPRGVKRRRESDENRMVGDRTDFCDPMNQLYSFGRAFYEFLAGMKRPAPVPHPQIGG